MKIPPPKKTSYNWRMLDSIYNRHPLLFKITWEYLHLWHLTLAGLGKLGIISFKWSRISCCTLSLSHSKCSTPKDTLVWTTTEGPTWDDSAREAKGRHTFTDGTKCLSHQNINYSPFKLSNGRFRQRSCLPRKWWNATGSRNIISDKFSVSWMWLWLEYSNNSRWMIDFPLW